MPSASAKGATLCNERVKTTWSASRSRNIPCRSLARVFMLPTESVGRTACEMGTQKTITAEYSVPTIESDELSAVILFGVEALA
jgi:hypothetical protein